MSGGKPDDAVFIDLSSPPGSPGVPKFPGTYDYWTPGARGVFVVNGKEKEMIEKLVLDSIPQAKHEAHKMIGYSRSIINDREIKIDEIKRIQYPEQRNVFNACVKLTEHRNSLRADGYSPGSCVTVGFHGTSSRNVEDIIKNGFSLRRQHQGNNYGAGIYFSKYIFIPLQHAEPDADGNQFVFVCRVIAGKKEATQRGTHDVRAEVDSGGDRNDSGHIGVVFNTHHILPEYILTIKTSNPSARMTFLRGMPFSFGGLSSGGSSGGSAAGASSGGSSAAGGSPAPKRRRPATLQVTSPTYRPSSPQYAPHSPAYAPTSLYYSPGSPGYSPTAPKYSPTAPGYSPTAPGYRTSYSSSASRTAFAGPLSSPPMRRKPKSPSCSPPPPDAKSP